MSNRLKSTQKQRLEIAEVAAKLIAIEGVADFHSAKRKAASQLGISPNTQYPKNQEIEQALITYQRLFQAKEQKCELKNLRMQAIEAMNLLQQFRPLLVGPVITGTATNSSEITIHLYVDQVERVGLYLLEHGIPNTLCERQIRINATKSMIFPAYRFIADQTSFSLIVFSEKDKNLSPVSSVDNKAMKMISVSEVMKMVEESKDSSHT